VKANSLRELLVEELKDLYDAENQLIKALPKMAEAASSEDLRAAIEEHLEKTEQQAERLKQVFSQLDETPKAQKCKGMEGLIKEGSDIIKEDDMDPEVKDAAIISAAQRVEHYEIAGYGCVSTWANLLGENEVASLLEQTLDEEKQADQTLNQIAEEFNVEAGAGEVEGEEAEEEEEGATTKARRGRTASRRKPAA
jgi:ferritin-like metal-binding protein YciE